MDVQNPPGRGRTPTVEIDVGAAYEFLMTLHVMTLLAAHEPGDLDYEVGEEWFNAVRAKASPDLLTAIDQFGLNYCGIWGHLFGLAYDCSPPRDVSSLIAHIEALDPFEIRLHLFGYYQRSFRRTTPLDIILQAAEDDQEAQRQFLKTSFRDDADWQETLRHFFSMDARTTKTMLLDILRGWYDQVFRDQEQQILPILERDAEAKRALKQTMTVERLVETATNGLEYVPEPAFRKVLLIPSYVLRPWNEPSEYQDIKIFCYPVADESVVEDGNVPPVRLVRLYKALADERRLRILKMLMTRSYSLQELTDEFGIAKSTMHHHLATLRTAGLVRARPDDKVYSLRQGMLSEVSELLNKYLKGKS